MNRRSFVKYFKVEAPDAATAEEVLWTKDAVGDYLESGGYWDGLLRQYELYVSMADKVSDRRSQANAFFLTLNTGVVVAAAGFIDADYRPVRTLTIVALVALVGQSVAWFYTLRSYRQLNSAKFMVVGLLEKKLPARPYSDGEWAAIGKGKNPALYWPLTKIETFVPLLFLLLYSGLAVSQLIAIVCD